MQTGVSQEYYRRLKHTPAAELLAGNITRSLSKDILKVISSEVKEQSHLHSDILMEMYMTQNIMRECDNKFYRMPGYIQHLPFGVHLYTETGISILVQHLRRKAPVSLYLDAGTGNVVTKIPNQKKRVLYYSLTLPGGGHNAPVSEMLTNEHSIPPITNWIMKFLLQVSQYTRLRIHKVETDYSWALMQSVLIGFNKESVVSYLERAFAICSGKKTWNEIRSFTVLHLCSAQILKAIAQVTGRKTDDKGLKQFIIFGFARLQNTASLGAAPNIFRPLCTVLLATHLTKTVQKNLAFIKKDNQKIGGRKL